MLCVFVKHQGTHKGSKKVLLSVMIFTKESLVTHHIDFFFLVQDNYVVVSNSKFYVP